MAHTVAEGEGERTSPRLSNLSPAEMRAVNLMVESPGKPARHIAQEIGSSPASSIARRLGTNGDLRAHVRALLAARGWDDGAILDKWGQLAQSKVVSRVTHKGVVTAEFYDDALDVQVKATENLTKLARLYPVTDEDQAARGLGPPALMIQLNLGTAAPSGDAGQVSIALGHQQEDVTDAPPTTDPGAPI
jgi:hypothetical protein